MATHDTLTPALLCLLLAQAQRLFAAAAEIRSMHGRQGLPANLGRALTTLEERSYLSGITHHTGGLSRRPIRRRFLTEEGVMALAAFLGITPYEVMSAYQANRRAQRIMLERIDTVADTHRLAATIGESVREAACPVTVEIERSGPLDAVIRLADGRAFGVIWQNRTLSGKPFGNRAWRMTQGTPMPSRYMVFVTDGDEKIRAQIRFRRYQRSVPVVLATKREALASPTTPTWVTTVGHTKQSLAAVLDASTPVPGYTSPWRRTYKKLYMPVILSEKDILPLVTAPQRAILETLVDWSLLTAAQIVTFTGQQTSVTKDSLASLQQVQLTTWTGPWAGARRHVLTDEALIMLSAAHRSSRKRLLNAWSPGQDGDGIGGSLTKLIRERIHTTSVHAFMARLVAEYEDDIELVPPHRAARYFFMGQGIRSVAPDAVAVLRQDDRRQTILLEYECSATTPSRIRQKLRPWLGFFSSPRARDEFVGEPIILFVLPDSVVEKKVLSIATEMARSQGGDLPLATTSEAVLNSEGSRIMGASWWLAGTDDFVRRNPFLSSCRQVGIRSRI